jgi:hypothetical protein
MTRGAKLTLQIGAREADGLLREVPQVDVRCERLVAQQNLEDLCVRAGTVSTLPQPHDRNGNAPPRSFSPGRSTSNRRGSRRSTASSRSNGRFVAPMTMTRSWRAERRPSISCMNSVITPRCATAPPVSRDAAERAPKSASSSSMKTTHGARRRASEKTDLTSFSPSPTYCACGSVSDVYRQAACTRTYHIHDVGRRDDHHACARFFGERPHDECLARARRPE